MKGIFQKLSTSGLRPSIPFFYNVILGVEDAVLLGSAVESFTTSVLENIFQWREIPLH